MDNNSQIKSFLNDFVQQNKRIYISKLPDDIKMYLESLYDDSDSIQESIYRCLNNINKKPLCRCGKCLKFKNIHKGYFKHCSQHCAQSDPDVYEHIVEEKKKKYGTANNYNKIKSTIKEKYGVDYILQLPEKHEQIKQTSLTRYGNENYRNIEKSKQTCLERYGVEYWYNSDDCKNKTIEKFGVDNYRKTDECKQKVSNFIKNNKEEINQKKISTFLNRYGVDNPMKIEYVKNKIDWKQQKQKEYETKRKNGTFNTSTVEIDSYNILKEKYPDVIYHYKDKERYPFVCDFYIPSLDLFIECNYHWTHGGKPFEGTKDDQKRIENWKSKNSKYYDNAINCWTIRDVKKRNTAKENNLNYLEIWNLDEIKSI